ncbi:MAG: phosphoglycerate dehydrogenase [Planctomycetaceae bacterium]
MSAPYRVLLRDNLSSAAVELLKGSPEIEVVDERELEFDPAQLTAVLQTVDAVIIRSKCKMTPAILEGQTRLKLIVRAGVGVDNIDQPAATRNGIIVSNTPAGNTTSTAEHAIAMMMALSRNIGPASNVMREGGWDRNKYQGTQVAGKTIGVVGLGRIGLEVARRCRGLEMTVLGYDPFLTEERAKELGIELFRDIDELVKRCQYITVHTPLTEQTRNLLNAERLAMMPRGGRVINCARGGIVDEEALADAVESGHVAGAALDVFVKEPPAADSRLRKLPQILCTPHLGASTDEAQEQVAIEGAEIVQAFLVRNEIRHAVNMAPVSAREMQGLRPYLDLGYRLGLLLAQLTQGRAQQGVRLHFRGDAASQPVKLITNAFTAGLLSRAMDDSVNLINAEFQARGRGIEISSTSSNEMGAFSTLVTATIETDQGAVTAAGTMFGNDFLRLVRLEDYQMDAYLDGTMLVYRHRDVPGLIGAIGTVFGKYGVNISHLALGRERNEPGGNAIAVLNVDNDPSEEAMCEISGHPNVTGLQLVHLPKAGAPLPWFGL